MIKISLYYSKRVSKHNNHIKIVLKDVL